MLEWLKFIAVGVFFAVFCAEIFRFLKKPVAPDYEVLETFEAENQALIAQTPLRSAGIPSDIYFQNYGMRNSGVFVLRVVPENAAAARAILAEARAATSEELPAEESEDAV